MVFSSLEFLFLFLPVFLTVYYIVPFRAKNLILLTGSFIFYGWGEPKYILLLLILSFTGYMCCLAMEKTRENRLITRLVLILSLAVCLGALMYYKYFGFIIENLSRLSFFNIEINAPALPIGVSFFTFQILSCCIDVYWGRVKAEKSIINFVCYVSMFPQLIAGPIVRFSDISRELHERTHSLDNFLNGASRLLIGIFKKVLIADRIGTLWTVIKAGDYGEMSVLTAWLGIICFTLQLYYDFSGYGDMAIGMGRMMGFNYLENFDYPLFSKSITEFWRRWHMALSSWFRDYVYIPLGGNRCSKARHILNIFIVWGLTGIWHGASWNFLIWGLYYACLLAGEKYIWGKALKKLPSAVKHLYSVFIVVVGFGIFDLTGLGEILSYFKVLFFAGSNPLIDRAFLYNITNGGVVLLMGIIFSAPLYRLYINRCQSIEKKGVKCVLLFGDGVIRLVLFGVAVSFMVSSSYSPFLYFRF
ncbi:MAG: MBOAT family protein [Clostridiales bacterium]|nr:MBOAT family protein [Clostridiales bacterium]